MAVLTKETVSAGIKDVEHFTFVKAVRPRLLPIVGAYATRKLVEGNIDALKQDFPNVVEGYTQSLQKVIWRLQKNRAVARYIITGETWVGTPFDSYSHIGMLSMVPGEIDDIPETIGGVNVAAWLTSSHAGNGYLTRLAAELATEGHPEQMIWTVARTDNPGAIGLLSNIGMSTVGMPAKYDIGDNVSGERQLFAATVGDVAQTARVYAHTHYPVQQI